MKENSEFGHKSKIYRRYGDVFIDIGMNDGNSGWHIGWGPDGHDDVFVRNRKTKDRARVITNKANVLGY